MCAFASLCFFAQESASRETLATALMAAIYRLLRRAVEQLRGNIAFAEMFYPLMNALTKVMDECISRGPTRNTRVASVVFTKFYPQFMVIQPPSTFCRIADWLDTALDSVFEQVNPQGTPELPAKLQALHFDLRLTAVGISEAVRHRVWGRDPVSFNGMFRLLTHKFEQCGLHFPPEKFNAVGTPRHPFIASVKWLALGDRTCFQKDGKYTQGKTIKNIISGIFFPQNRVPWVLYTEPKPLPSATVWMLKTPLPYLPPFVVMTCWYNVHGAIADEGDKRAEHL